MKMNIWKINGSNKKAYKLLLILLIGVCLMIVVWPTDKSGGSAEKNGENRSQDKQTALGIGDEGDGFDMTMGPYTESDVTEKYISDLENRLEAMLEKMGGISDVSVMITVKDGGEMVPLKDTGTSSSESSESVSNSVTEETVMSSDGNSSKPCMTRYIEPEIEGVVVCCKGADVGETSLKITNAVQALFDVPVHKIVVLEAN